jgi:hypothetical protein
MSRAGPSWSRWRFAERTVARGTAQIAELRLKQASALTLAAVIEADPEAWKRRRAESLAQAQLRRSGWRPDPAGKWIAPGSGQRTEFEFAVKALASATLAQPAPRSATARSKQ